MNWDVWRNNINPISRHLFTNTKNYSQLAADESRLPEEAEGRQQQRDVERGQGQVTGLRCQPNVIGPGFDNSKMKRTSTWPPQPRN